MAFLIPTAQAHVKYVLEEETIHRLQSGTDWKFVTDPLRDGQNIALMLATLIAVFFLIVIIEKVGFLHKRAMFIQHRAEAYQNIISWILRLSIGIALIGAGTSGFLISPALTITNTLLSTLQIALGFAMMIGLLLMPALWVIVGLFLVGLMRSTYLLGNIELVAAAIALLILANPWPGLDHLLGIPFPGPPKKWHHAIPFILRLGLGSAMIYLAIYEKFLNPHFAAEVVVRYQLDQAVPVSPAMWVVSTGIIEAALGTALILGFNTRVVAAIAVLVLSASFFYFNEAAYSHITLFGVLAVLFITGSGWASLDARINKRNSVRLGEVRFVSREQY